jgi:hypothetical protein
MIPHARDVCVSILEKLDAFPRPVVASSRLFYVRDDIEAFKATIVGRPPPPPSKIMELVDAKTFARELNCHRVTLGRYAKESAKLRAAKATAE